MPDSRLTAEQREFLEREWLSRAVQVPDNAAPAAKATRLTIEAIRAALAEIDHWKKNAEYASRAKIATRPDSRRLPMPPSDPPTPYDIARAIVSDWNLDGKLRVDLVQMAIAAAEARGRASVPLEEIGLVLGDCKEALQLLVLDDGPWSGAVRSSGSTAWGRALFRRSDAMTELTPIQAELLEFLVAHVEEHGAQPSMREVMRHFKWASPNAVAQQMSQLQKKGHIRSSKGNRRCVEFVGLRFVRQAK